MEISRLRERKRERRPSLSLFSPPFPLCRVGGSVKNAREQFLGTDVPRCAITSVTSPPPSLPPLIRLSDRPTPRSPRVRSLSLPTAYFRARVCTCVCVAAAPGSRGENTALSFYPTPPYNTLKVAAISRE